MALLAGEHRAQGRDVMLFAARGSVLATHPIAPRQWSAALGSPDERFRELTYAARVIDGISDSGSVDVIHDHNGAGVLFGLALQSATPIVHTVHGAVDEPVRTFLEALPRRVGLIAISRAQRASAAHLPCITTVHNAVDVNALHAAQPEAAPPYLLCLA